MNRYIIIAFQIVMLVVILMLNCSKDAEKTSVLNRGKPFVLENIFSQEKVTAKVHATVPSSAN